MTTISTKDLQLRLIAAGYSVGKAGADGVFGRNTRAAVVKFQADQKLDIKWPGTVGPKTIEALNNAALKGKPGKAAAPVLEGEIIPPWVAEARRKMGLHETRNNAELKAYLKSDGKTLGDPAKLPWCGDFIETCIALTLPSEPMVVNPYWARNWLKFGKALSKDKPALGAIGVVERGSGGHVFFVVGHDKTYLHALGGNQSNSISIVKIAKSRLLGLRWPSTFAMPTKVLPITTLAASISTNEA